jgi:hypothetical protein
MACFLSTVAAVRCATRIQRALAAHTDGDVRVKVRIGAARVFQDLGRRFAQGLRASGQGARRPAH